MAQMGAPPPCSALALDVGHRRIGLAGCDPLGITVTPLAPLHRQDFEVDAQTIATHFLEGMAQQHCPEAQWKLSEWLHQRGDVEEARHWAVQAARQNHLTARVWLATRLLKEGSAG